MHTPTPYITKHLVRHYFEMVAVMLAGMAVLGTPAAWALGNLADEPVVMFALMGATMTGPMVGWMAWRGHGARANAEMAATMVLPTLAAIALVVADGVSDTGPLMAAEHVVMLTAMAGLMVARRAEYGGGH